MTNPLHIENAIQGLVQSHHIAIEHMSIFYARTKNAGLLRIIRTMQNHRADYERLINDLEMIRKVPQVADFFVALNDPICDIPASDLLNKRLT